MCAQDWRVGYGFLPFTFTSLKGHRRAAGVAGVCLSLTPSENSWVRTQHIVKSWFLCLQVATEEPEEISPTRKWPTALKVWCALIWVDVFWMENERGPRIDPLGSTTNDGAMESQPYPNYIWIWVIVVQSKACVAKAFLSPPCGRLQATQRKGQAETKALVLAA